MYLGFVFRYFRFAFDAGLVRRLISINWSLLTSGGRCVCGLCVLLLILCCLVVFGLLVLRLWFVYLSEFL